MRRVPEAVSSVDTAHAVDGDFLDEQFLGDDCFSDVSLFGSGGGVLLVHTYESTCQETH